MKKLLSLFVLLVAIVTGAQATDWTVALTNFTKDGNTYTYEFSETKLNTYKSGLIYVEVPSASASGTISWNAGSAKADRILYIYKENGTVKDETRGIAMPEGWSEPINYTSNDILTNEGKYYLVFNTQNDWKAKGIKYTVAAATNKPTITTQPVGATYQVDATPAALTVEATASAGELSYTWYSNTTGTADPNSDTAVDAGSATLSAANISTASVGTTYYYVVITDGNGSVTSDVVAIEVVTEEAPEVSASASASAARTGATVTLTADVTAGVPAPTLQWYSCDDAEGTNAVAISGATNATYQPSTENIGTYYFLVKASNSAAADVASNVVSLKIVDGGTSGAVADLTAVSEGYVFIADNVTADGTLSPAANTIYDDGKLFVSTAFTVARNKGSNTFAGESHFNSMRLKNTTDYIAFKVDEPCMVTFYVENPNKNRNFKVGNAANDDTFGTIPDGQTTASILIPEAGTVYVTGPGGDRYMAGFEVKAVQSTTINLNASGFATYSSKYDFTFEGAQAYKMALDEGAKTLTGTEVTGKIKAGEGILFKGDANAEVTITETAGATALDGNSLVGSTKADGTTAEKPENCYALSGDTFKKFTGDALVANKAFFATTSASAIDFDIVFDEGEATAVDAIAEANANAAAPVKVIKNGKLYIGNFNVAGQQVK